MEILVTGANGLLGRHLVAALQERGERVRALVLPTEGATWLQQRGVAVHVGDIRFPETLREPLRGVQGAFHLAALMGVWRPLADYRAVNVAGTENVCRAALAAGVSRLVHVSSAMVYRLWVGQPVGEVATLRPLREPYAMSKAEGDTVVQRMIVRDRLPAIIVRPGTMLGPGDRLNFERVADRLRAGRAIVIGSGRNALPLVYVTDVVQGLLRAFDRDGALGQAYNIGNDQFLTQEGLLRAIAEEIGARPPSLHVPYHALYALAFSAERLARLSGYRHQPVVTRHGVALYGGDNRLAIEKARRELGYAPEVSLRAGVRLAAAWYLRRAERPSALPAVAASPSERERGSEG